jgi:hypothetical protein
MLVASALRPSIHWGTRLLGAQLWSGAFFRAGLAAVALVVAGRVFDLFAFTPDPIRAGLLGSQTGAFVGVLWAIGTPTALGAYRDPDDGWSMTLRSSLAGASGLWWGPGAQIITGGARAFPAYHNCISTLTHSPVGLPFATRSFACFASLDRERRPCGRGSRPRERARQVGLSPHWRRSATSSRRLNASDVWRQLASQPSRSRPRDCDASASDEITHAPPGPLPSAPRDRGPRGGRGAIGPPVRYAILGDIHSNVEALRAVLDALDQQPFNGLICTADLVGYGASPREVIRLVRDLEPTVLVGGNHDWAAAGRLPLEYFNPFARDAILWTRKVLDRHDLEWLGRHPALVMRGEVTVSHGTIHDPEARLPAERVRRAPSFAAAHALRVQGYSHVPVTFRSGTAVTYMIGDVIGPATRPGVMNGQRAAARRDPRAAFGIFDVKTRRSRCTASSTTWAAARASARRASRVLGDRLRIGR